MEVLGQLARAELHHPACVETAVRMWEEPGGRDCSGCFGIVCRNVTEEGGGRMEGKKAHKNSWFGHPLSFPSLLWGCFSHTHTHIHTHTHTHTHTYTHIHTATCLTVLSGLSETPLVFTRVSCPSGPGVLFQHEFVCV